MKDKLFSVGRNSVQHQGNLPKCLLKVDTIEVIKKNSIRKHKINTFFSPILNIHSKIYLIHV